MLELALHTLLAAHAPLVQLVGTRIALAELPEGSAYPALVYQVVSQTPSVRLCRQANSKLNRVQLNAIATDAVVMESVEKAALAALVSDTSRQPVANGLHLRSVRAVGWGPWSRDGTAGVWTRACDLFVFTQEP